ncbi:MAG: type II toxin-antitoxin system ParD family antitoxin [Rhodoferax sp.]|uniref:type II toxin-antitoxin system ParD family antitoxin n=1 Tax=Rhodoferax sp. TaxID=50421 RepID=UPI0026078E58|nr:type II toxin-antitoxin system ParD family antitoxin [Rhodoferax sp.]MDD2882210.1 type II toxin-antitoxin system ParD family antitoxin [Rhodoferax sp.]
MAKHSRYRSAAKASRVYGHWMGWVIGIMCHTSIYRKAAMPTKNVVLTEHQAHFVENLVTSGRYQNASEVLREGLRLIEHRETEDQYRLTALKEAARIGIADINSGAYSSFTSADELKRHLASAATKVLGAK